MQQFLNRQEVAVPAAVMKGREQDAFGFGQVDQLGDFG